jgi:hypothetical protein
MDGKGWMYAQNEISQSRMKDYLKCPLSYYYARVNRGGRGPASAALPMGSAFHAAVESFHNSVRKGFEPDPDLIMDIAKVEFEKQYERFGKQKEPRICGVDASMGYPNKSKDYTPPARGIPLHEIEGAMERAVKNVQWWVTCYMEAYNAGELTVMDGVTIGCEIDYRRFDEELGVFLRGKLDIVFDERMVGDWKTCSTNPQWQFSQLRADAEFQADYYAGIMLGDEDAELTFVYISTTKEPHPDYQKQPRKNKDGSTRKGSAPFPKKARTVVHTTKRTKADVEALKERIAAFLAMTDVLNNHKDGFFGRDASPNAYTHCDKMCDFKDRCLKEMLAERGASE